MRPTILLRYFAIFAAIGLALHAATSQGPAPAAASGSAAASASGRDTSAPARNQPPPTPQVAVTFKTMALNNAVSGVYYRSGNMTIPLSAQTLTESQNTFTYYGPDKMEFLRPDPRAAAPAPDAAADTASGAAPAVATATGSGQGRGRNAGRGRGGAPTGPMKTVGAVTFPKNGSYMLYLAGENGGAVSGIALTNGAEDYPVGSIRFVNVTEFPLAVKIGDSAPMPVKVNGFYVYKATSTNPFVAQIFRTDVDPATIATGSQLTPPSGGERTSAFIYISNHVDMIESGAAPAFNILFLSSTLEPARGGPGRAGPGGQQGRNGRGAGNGATGRPRGGSGG